MTLPTQNRLLCAFLSIALFACGDRPQSGDAVTNPVTGIVYMTAPVQGAIVRAYDFNPETGETGTLLGESEPTEADGVFSMELAPAVGAVLFEARGPVATWTEPASGSTAPLGGATRLRAIPATRSKTTGLVSVGLEFGKNIEVAIGPISELAVTYAYGLRESGGSMLEHLQTAYELFRAHFEYDFWRVAPRMEKDAALGAFDESTHATLIHIGLSHWARRIASASSAEPGSISSLTILEGLKADLAAGSIFDGQVAGGLTLPLGACPKSELYCQLSPRSARGDWAESIVLFLAEPTNKTGFRYPDVKDLVDRMSYRSSPLFLGPGNAPDSQPPRVVVEDLAFREVVVGTKEFRIIISDAFELGDNEPPHFLRQDQPFSHPTAFNFRETDISPGERHIDVTLKSDRIQDGTIKLVVPAVDTQGNRSAKTFGLEFATNNAPEGQISGTVTAGGRVLGAHILVFDATGGRPGDLLAETETEIDENGVFTVKIPEAPDATSLRIVATAPKERADGLASYIDPATGETLALSATDELEAIIEDYTDGATRVVHITPYTDMAAAFARAIWRTDGEAPERWAAAVKNAHTILEDHFDDGARIDLRTVPPADPTRAEEMSTLNAQARYGLLIAGLSELARFHADETKAKPGVMNTLTLADLLAKDLSGDVDDAGGAARPLWNGFQLRQKLAHGDIPATSYWTRDELAHGIADWIEKNPNDKSSFSLLDIEHLVDKVSLDADQRLYPLTDEPKPFDRQDPTLEWVSAPQDNAIVRGSITLRVSARDNRKLLRTPSTRAGLDWSFSEGSIDLRGKGDLVGVDEPAGPWDLSITVNLDEYPEGPVSFGATVTDEAARSATITKTIIVDRTPPQVSILNASAGDDKLDASGVTGSEKVTIKASAVDDRALRAAEYRWNDGDWQPVTENAPDSSFTISAALKNGTNKIELRATDAAGNVAQVASASYVRDSSPPTIVFADGDASARLMDEKDTRVVNHVNPSFIPSLTYEHESTTTPVVTGIQFSKFSTTYLDPTNKAYPSSEPINLPEWRFNVTDNHSPSEAIVTEFRLRREPIVLDMTRHVPDKLKEAFQGKITYPLGDSGVVVDWSEVPHASGRDGFNRTILIHSGLAASIAEKSGVYVLEVRARDKYGNQSDSTSVQWTQYIMPPPLVQQDHDVSRAKLTSGLASYSLTDNTFAPLLNRSDLPLAAIFVTNPHFVPIEIKIQPFAMALQISVRVASRTERLGDFRDVTNGCENDTTKEQTVDGRDCAHLGPPPTMGNLLDGRAITVQIDRFETPGQECPTCKDGIIVIPPRQSVTIQGLASNPLRTMLKRELGDFEERSATVAGRHRDLTAAASPEYRMCSRSERDPETGGNRCTRQTRAIRYQYITSAVITTGAATMTVLSRLGRDAQFQEAAKFKAVTETLISNETGIRFRSRHSDF
jgi:hypothetical protein